MLLGSIVACEIAFWVVFAAGVVARYALRLPRLGAVLLVCAPLVDLVLLAVTVVDLRAGGEARWQHGLAALYIGFSAAFGHRTVRWADAHAAHRFRGGPRPPRAPRYGTARAVHEWKLFGLAVIAWAIACTLLTGASALVDDPASAAALTGWTVKLHAVLGIWALIALSYTVFPKRDPAARDRPAEPIVTSRR